MRKFEIHVIWEHGAETADHAQFLIREFLRGKGVHPIRTILNGKEIPGDYDRIEAKLKE